MKRPLGVIIISYLFGFSSMLLLFSAIFYDADTDSMRSIAERFALPNIPEQLMRGIVALFSLVMVYGYIQLKKWGFWTMVAYLVYFGMISSLLVNHQTQLPYIVNMLPSLAMLAYTIYVRKAFFNPSNFQH
ncbi:hypothetical protein ACFQ4Z_07945 [Oceanobacillus oncorhynchi subsp. oncorhynchi]|uniref:hypothetical protein n=1 Tax=Oceanobacillus oncorhynchi TaxID=545501 RepID=UPI0031DFCEAF